MLRQGLLVAGAVCWLASGAAAQQTENAAACLTMAVTVVDFGDHTTGCTFLLATEEDEFVLNGTVGTRVRVVVRGTTAGVAPMLRVVDVMSAPVPLLDPVTGNVLASPVVFAGPGSVEFLPAMSGDFILVFGESGRDNAGDYEFSLVCGAGPCDSDGLPPPDPSPPSVPLQDGSR